MSNVSIMLSADEQSSVEVFLAPEKGHFLSLQLGPSSVFFPGFNSECAVFARELATQLFVAAAKLEAQEAQRAAEQQVEAEAQS